MLEARRALRNTSDDGGAALPATDDLANAVRGVFAAASPGEAALGHCVLGELHSSQGRSGPAQQEFEAALVIDRTFVRALIGLGEVLHQVGRDSEALARFAAAAQEQPENLPAQLGIAKSQIRLAQLAEAKKTLTQLAAARPNHPEIIFWQGKAAQAVGEHDAALASYRAAIVAAKGSPESVEAYLALAKLQAELGQLAIARFRRRSISTRAIPARASWAPCRSRVSAVSKRPSPPSRASVKPTRTSPVSPSSAGACSRNPGATPKL
jgi:tetratricopeptide (TPR) repeat protein